MLPQLTGPGVLRRRHIKLSNRPESGCSYPWEPFNSNCKQVADRKPACKRYLRRSHTQNALLMSEVEAV